MADTTNATKTVLSIIATTASKVKDLTILNGQMIFVQDKSRIAFDFNDRRVFYNQITELDTEYERSSLSAPSSGHYFVIETAVLWYYGDEWVQLTTPPEDIVFIGAEMPLLGKPSTLYVDKANREISVWDEDTNGYIVVADKTEIDPGTVTIDIDTVTEDEINSLF